MPKPELPPIPEGFELEQRSEAPPIPEGFRPVEPERQNIINDPVGTVARSGGQAVTDFFSSFLHPIKTAEALGRLAYELSPASQGLVPGMEQPTPVLDGVIEMGMERYGSPEKAFRTVTEDPVGAALDVAPVLTGGGALLTKAGQASKVSRMSRAGQMMVKGGHLIDPVEMGMRGVARGVEAASKGAGVRVPGTGAVRKDVIGAADDVGKMIGEDVELPASATMTGKVPPLVEGLTSKGLFGNRIEKMLGKAQEQLVKAADQATTQAGPTSDLLSAGKAISKGADEYRDAFMKTKNALYDKAMPQARGRYVVFQPTQSLPFIEEILLQKRQAQNLIGQAGDLKFFEQLHAKMTPRKRKVPVRRAEGGGKRSLTITEMPGVTAADVRASIQELNERLRGSTDPIVTGNRGKLNKLVALMQEDLEAAIKVQDPKLWQDLDAANRFYEKGITLINSAFGEKIKQFASQPDKIMPAILDKRVSVEDVPRIYEVIGPDNAMAVQSAFLEDLFSKAKNDAGVFTPSGISKQVRAYGEERLQAILTPEQFRAVKNLETLSKSLGPLDRVVSGSQTAFLGRLAAELGPVLVNPMLSLQLIAGDYGFSKLVASPLGQEMLSGGANLAKRSGLVSTGTVRRAAPVAGRAAQASRGAALATEGAQP